MPAIRLRSAASGIAARAKCRSRASTIGTAPGARRRNINSLINKYSDQGKVVERSGFDTQIISDAAIDFLRNRDSEKPIFIFIGYATTHNPWINRPERLVSNYRKATLRDIPGDMPYPFGEAGTHPVAPADPREALAQYYASVTMIDDGVGRVLDELDAQRERGETLIVYTADHGLNMGHHGIWGKGNGSVPLNMLEESIRVPLILNQKGVIDGGQMRSEFVNHTDLFKTLLHAAAAVPVDMTSPGQSFLDRFSKADNAPGWQNSYIGEYGPVRAIRDDRYKLVLRYDGGENLLHDLEQDPRETVNLYYTGEYDHVIEKLRVELEDLFAARQVPQNSGTRGNDLPVHNRHEAWRTKELGCKRQI